MVKRLIKYGAVGALFMISSAIVLTKLSLSSLTVERTMLAVSLLVFLGLGIALKKHA
ncbi:hypothetical protein ACWYVZ_00280 [Pediococcus acidilactici]